MNTGSILDDLKRRSQDIGPPVRRAGGFHGLEEMAGMKRSLKISLFK